MMSHSPNFISFREQLSLSLSDGTFIKLTLSNYHGEEEALKNIYVRAVRIKNGDLLAFTYRFKTRDMVKNLSYADGIEQIITYLSDNFDNCTCFTTRNDLVLSRRRGRDFSLRTLSPTLQSAKALNHDREKKRLITTLEKPYLQALKITDDQGAVFKNAQDKYKQINQYVALLDPLIRELSFQGRLNVADMGSGKGYLTFALYDYLVNVLQQEVSVTGVEYRQDLVDLCNHIAEDAGFGDLHFVRGTIEEFKADKIDLLIALHACDTATDDAIYQGIRYGAELIVVAPCCHKQIRREIQKGKVVNDLDFLTRYGIFLERQAEMVTDGLRALIMEYFGYKTKVFEFISDAHTPKNVLVVGIRQKGREVDREVIMEKIKSTKAYFGISYHHLEKCFTL